MQKNILLTVCLITVLSVQAQIKWPAITQTTKPWTRWWWEGSAVNKKDLTWNLEQYQKAGLGGVEITPIYGVHGYEKQFVDFLSPQWMQLLDHTLAESKRLGLGVDLANATGWPFGGPWVTDNDASKSIYFKTYTLNDGEQLNEVIEYKQQALVRTANNKPVSIDSLLKPVSANKNLQALALDQIQYPGKLPLRSVIAYSDANAVWDITDKVDKNGKLNWTAGDGKWKLYALFEGLHGKMVERAAPGGEGYAIDHFSATASENYFKKFDESFKGHDISYLRSFFNDSYEVDDARGQANWTPDFFEQFKKRRGYDLKNYLPQLFARDTTDISRRVLVDYRQTVSDLILDNFTKPWQHWAALQKKMVRNQSHGSPANILDCYAVVDIPETEGADILRFKFATSTANVMGKPLASAETATWLNEHFQSSLGDVKQAVDKYFIGGVNHVFWHGTNYSPQNDPWPGWLFYAAVHFTPANPFWKDFGTLNNYVARCQSFLQQGKADNDVLLYFPFNDRNAEPGRDMLHHYDGMDGFEKTDFKSSAEFMLEKGYSFNLISDKQLLLVKNKGNEMQVGGVSYHTIVLPNCKYLPLETLQQLTALAKNGATIIFYKGIPKDVPGLGDLKNRQAMYDRLLSQLFFVQTNSETIKEAKIGKGSFLLGTELYYVVNYANARSETLTEEGLKFVRRKISNGFNYFISNSSKKEVDGWININCAAASVALYDPMDGKSGLAEFTKGDHGTTDVYLQLKPGESCILQTNDKMISGNKYEYYQLAGTATEIKGNWKITFILGGPSLPPAVETTSLGSWTDLQGEDVKRFSGTAQYSIEFIKPAGESACYLLDLGNVQETAEVFFNGKKLETLIGPVFQLVIDAALLKQNNLLQINVTNGMPNRIADMEKRGVVWKKFYNTNFPSRLAGNRGSDGLFTAIKWKPKASGLIGPVTLTSVQIKKEF